MNYLFRYDRADQAALDLKSGRIEVLEADSDPGAMLAKQIGGLQVALKALVTSGPVNIALPLNDTDTVRTMNDIIKAYERGFHRQAHCHVYGPLKRSGCNKEWNHEYNFKHRSQC